MLERAASKVADLTACGRAGALIKSGADVNAKDKTGATALSLAANTGVVGYVTVM